MGKLTHTDVGAELTKTEWEAEATHKIGGVADLNIVRTATYVVAAYNAPAHVKAQADYVCDGTADGTEINAAISALSTTGGRVVLTEGLFTLSGNGYLNINKSNVILHGQGAATIIKAENGYVGSDGSDRIMARIYGTVGTPISNVRVEGIYFDGNRANVTEPVQIVRLNYAGKVYFDNVSFHAPPYMGMVLETGVYDVFVARSRFSGNKNTGNNGAYVYTATSTPQAWFSDVSFDTHDDQAFYIGGGTVIVNRAYFKNVNIAFDVRSGALGQLTNSLIDGGANFSIILQGDRSTVRSVKIINTTNTTINGIIQVLGNENILDDLTIVAADDVTARTLVDFVSGSRNTLTNSRLYGSKLSSNAANLVGFGYSSAVGNTVENNILSHSFAAFHFFAGTAGANYARNNTVSDFNYYLLDPTNSPVSSLPYFKDSGNPGHVTENSGTATITDNTTSIAVNHGLAYTPVAGDIVVTPSTSLGVASKFWVDTYTSTQFTIHVNIDPDASVGFVWLARKN